MYESFCVFCGVVDGCVSEGERVRDQCCGLTKISCVVVWGG